MGIMINAKVGAMGLPLFVFEKIVIKLLMCEIKNAIMCNNKCKYNECRGRLSKE